jgi:hypothetical protein
MFLKDNSSIITFNITSDVSGYHEPSDMMGGGHFTSVVFFSKEYS